MIYTSVAVLLILWLFGLVTSYTIGGLANVLLVVSVIVVLLKAMSQRTPI